jgi:hypothetical protein
MRLVSRGCKFIDQLINWFSEKGTGILGDFLPSLIDFFKKRRNIKTYVNLNVLIQKTVKKNWNLKNQDIIRKYTKCIWDIINVDHLDKLIYEYSFDDSQEYSFDFAIFKTIIEFRKEYKKVKPIDLIEMAIDWNRFDVAKSELLHNHDDLVKLKLINIYNFFYFSFFPR